MITDPGYMIVLLSEPTTTRTLLFLWSAGWFVVALALPEFPRFFGQNDREDAAIPR
jgi:hypothetical protein